MDTNYFFLFTFISCMAGVIAGIIRLKSSRVKQIHLFSIIVLVFLAGVYLLAWLSRIGLIPLFQELKNGVLTSVGVFMLSTLFTTMFIVGCKRK